VITLAIDTCLGACSVAVIDDNEVLASACEPMTRGHQERLGPLTRDVAAAARVAFDQIDRIGVTVGPGSFTGLRVGLAFAKGLALALDRPCIGVGSLDALAASAGVAWTCVAIIDAGRGNVYWRRFDGGNAMGAPDVAPVEILAARLVDAHDPGDVTLAGPSPDLMAAISATARHLVLASPDPAALARLAARATVAPPHPLYLRPPDAKPKAGVVVT